MSCGKNLKEFLTNVRSDYAQLLASNEWYAKLAHLADIFYHLNELNTQMQGRNENPWRAISNFLGALVKSCEVLIL